MSTCPVCGSRIRDWTPSCPNCGVALEWEDERDYHDVYQGYEYYSPQGRLLRGLRSIQSTWLIIGGSIAALFACACACCFGLGVAEILLSEDESVTKVAQPSPAAPIPMTPGKIHTQQVTPTPEPTAVLVPTPTPVIAQPLGGTPEAEPVAPPEPEPKGRTMYACGYDRCRDSGEYGNLIYEAGINVWNNPDPDRGGVHHKVAHNDEVVVIGEKRVNDGPGGLWYELEDGGWIDDLWLTDAPCNLDNLSEYSFTSCWEGE